MQARRQEFDNMRDMAQKISQSSGDTRTASYANQLFSRFQALASAVKVGICNAVSCNVKEYSYGAYTKHEPANL